MRDNIIYSTTNYTDFVLKDANREVNEDLVHRIAVNMIQNGWVGAPIEVSLAKDGKFAVEDGQHRLKASEIASIPVKFMVVKPRDTYEVAQQNSIRKSWTGCDYIRAYANDGNYNYKRIRNLEGEFYQLSLSDILSVAISSDNGKTREKLQKGYVHVSDEEYYRAREILKSLVMMNESLKATGIKTTAPYKRTLVKLMKHDIIDHDRMIDKLDKYGKMLLSPTATNKQALENLEVLYNYHQHKNTIVMFRERLKSL